MGDLFDVCLFWKFLLSKVGKAWFFVGLMYGLCIAHWTKPAFPVFLVLAYLSGIVYMHFVQHYVYLCLCVQISCFRDIIVACSLFLWGCQACKAADSNFDISLRLWEYFLECSECWLSRVALLLTRIHLDCLFFSDLINFKGGCLSLCVAAHTWLFYKHFFCSGIFCSGHFLPCRCLYKHHCSYGISLECTQGTHI